MKYQIANNHYYDRQRTYTGAEIDAIYNSIKVNQRHRLMSMIAFMGVILTLSYNLVSLL